MITYVLNDSFLRVEGSDRMQAESVDYKTYLLIFLEQEKVLFGGVVFGGLKQRLQWNETDDLRANYGQS